MNYKGFDKNLKCRNFQYEIGKEYEMQGDIKACSNGFHSCENPLDVFGWYSPANSRFCEVDVSGNVNKDTTDTKVASSKIKIGVELSLKSMIDAGFNFVFEHCKKVKGDHATGGSSASAATGDSSASVVTGGRSASVVTGDSSASAATGGRSASAATGDRSASVATGGSSASLATGGNSASVATGYSSASVVTGGNSASLATGGNSASVATGYSSASVVTGGRSASLTTGTYSSSEIVDTANIKSSNSIAIGFGIENKAKAPVGSWLCLSEWVCDDNEEKWDIYTVKTVKVDGEFIKANTWYRLKNGIFVEVES